MAISPYRSTTDPFRPIFDDLFGSLTGGHLGNMLRAPHADVTEDQNGIRVMVELPGMRPEDVQVDLENNVLTISGEKREERTEGDEKNQTWHLSERRYGRFSRSFVLPRDVEQEQIQASFENGVLSLTIPKSAKARRRRIEIQGQDQSQVGSGSAAENGGNA